jgi:hypothetical protein
MRPTPRPLVAALLVLSLAGRAAIAAGADETRRLAAGEVLTDLYPVHDGLDEGVGRGVIKAPIERIARALADLEHWEEFMPYMDRSDAKAQPDGSILCAQHLSFPPPIGDLHYTIRARIHPGHGVWRAVWSAVPGSGNLKSHRGSWELTRLSSGQTLVAIRIYTEPASSTPAWAMNHATRKMLIWILDGLRQQVRRSRYDG